MEHKPGKLEMVILIVLIAFVALALVVAVLLTKEDYDQLEGVTPTPGLPKAVVTLDACVDSCLEEYEPGTVEHRDCASECFGAYLEEVGE